MSHLRRSYNNPTTKKEDFRLQSKIIYDYGPCARTIEKIFAKTLLDLYVLLNTKKKNRVTFLAALIFF